MSAANLQPNESAIKTNYSGDSPQTLNPTTRSKTPYIRLNLTMLEERYNFINWRFLFGLMEASSSQGKENDKRLVVNTTYRIGIVLLFALFSRTLT